MSNPGDIQAADTSIAHASSSKQTIAGPANENPNDIVWYGNMDIARSVAGEQIRVGVPGRARFGKIWVRETKTQGKKTTRPYDFIADAPTEETDILPTQAEREGRPGTIEMLCVGLVLGSVDPKTYSSKGSGVKSLQKEEERKRRGVLQRDPKALRAIIPTTEYVAQPNIKYYVACHKTGDLCDFRVISYDAIFFFEEFWSPEIKRATVKATSPMLAMSCKKAAATIKTQEERKRIPVASSANATSTRSNLLEVTPSANIGNLLLLQWSTWLATRNPTIIKSMKASFQTILPDLKHAPKSGNMGVASFYDFQSALTVEAAEMLLEEVKAACPNMFKVTPSLNSALTIKLHECLRENKLGAQLSYRSIGLFIALSHKRALAAWEKPQIEQVVKQVLEDMSVMDTIEYTSISSNTGAVLVQADFVPFVTALRRAIKAIVQYLRGYATALRDQHGGIGEHASIEDLMIKIGNCVDRTSLILLEEQVFALHADQLAGGNMKGVEMLEQLISFIDQALGVPGVSSP